jgi:hypothetical protein
VNLAKFEKTFLRKKPMTDLQEQFPNLPERLTGLGELAYNLW